MDRPDLNIPSIFDTHENKEFALRDSHRWLLEKVNP